MRETIHLLAIVLVMALLAGVSSARAGEPAAIVTGQSGSARLLDGRAVALLAELADGAEIVLESSSRVVLVHVGSQSSVELAGPGSFVIRAGGVEGRAGARPPATRSLSASFRDVRLRPSRVAQASVSMRGGSGGEQLRLLAPVATWLIAPDVRLRWVPPTAATSYSVQLTDSENRVVYSTETRDTAIALPESVRLEPGRLYGWLVKAALPSGGTLEAWSEFGVADAALRAKADAARPAANASSADRIAYALLLEGLNLWEAAREQWTLAVHEHPSDARLRAFAEGR